MTLPLTHCRIWDGQTMHYLPNLFSLQEEYATVWLEDALVLIHRINPAEKRRYEPASPWQLMLTVGQSDSQGTPIYDEDIVECQGYVWVVKAHRERCGYSLFRPNLLAAGPYVPLDAGLAEVLTVVGNSLEDCHLLDEVPAQAA